MDEYLDKVSLDRIKEIRLKIAERAARPSPTKGGKKESSSEVDDPQFREENWEFLMIHTSKKAVDDIIPVTIEREEPSPQDRGSIKSASTTSSEDVVPNLPKKDTRKRKQLDFQKKPSNCQP